MSRFLTKKPGDFLCYTQSRYPDRFTPFRIAANAVIIYFIMRTIPYPQHRTQTLIEQALIAIFIGAVVFVSAVGVFITGYQMRYAGLIYPGVTIGGIDVSGLSADAAGAKITREINFPQQGRLLVQGEGRSWFATPAEVGLFLDPGATAQRAFEIGRSQNLVGNIFEQFNTWYYGAHISPIMVFDQRMSVSFIDAIASEVDLPVIEPALNIQGVEVMVKPGQVGRYVDKDATLALLAHQVEKMQDGVIPLVVREERPVIEDLSGQAELARRILSQPLTLVMPEDQTDEKGPWTFEPDQLAALLRFERVEDENSATYELSVHGEPLGTFLYSISESLVRYPVNTRFIFNDDTRQLEVIEPATIGRNLDVYNSVEMIKEKLLNGEHTVPLEFTYTPPAVTDDMTGEQLGITELVHADASYFFGSGPERIQNIRASAARFHGLLVPPGGTFSMASALGDISLDNGYAEALIIIGGRTVKGVGGGICQVSTTLFRTVFFGGYPIVERHPHAYRVSYYEKDSANRVNPRFAGLDAAVFVPLVDFKFTNDTPYWLLMETYLNPAGSLTWKFYSTKDGRSVTWDTTGITNVVEAPKPLYKENPELPTGKIRQVDWAADGADVTVYRTVTRNGQVYIQDTIHTNYRPWQAIYEYGPGTEGMPPDEDEDGDE
jgi:vancomycin resistance protein YoaR